MPKNKGPGRFSWAFDLQAFRSLPGSTRQSIVLEKKLFPMDAADHPRSSGDRRPRMTRGVLLLVVAERVGELVVIFGDEIDVALVLDRRRRRFQGLVEIGEGFFLVLGGHLLVGLDLGDLRLDDDVGANIFLGRRIEAAEHQADIVDDGVVFVEPGKAVLLGDGVELRGELGIRPGIVRQLRGDRIHVLLRRQHALDLLVGQRDLLQHGQLRRFGLRRWLALRQRAVCGYDGHQGREAGHAEQGCDGTGEQTHGNLLRLGAYLNWYGSGNECTLNSVMHAVGKSWPKEITYRRMLREQPRPLTKNTASPEGSGVLFDHDT